ncbi:MAG: peptidoglycan-associated lipoprotein Pal [Proteobacteria bacterium]|nr:peptidoglycan-associated lipoprotein Pal [Pseudomonadota bacterium]MBU1686640.1 peptidoglycan-associated lipoprotein Pal [Pseudomonadota bacterium]
METMTAPPVSTSTDKTTEPVEVTDRFESADLGNDMGSSESLDSPAIAEDSADMGTPLEGRTTNGLYPVYFDFDSSVIRADQIERIELNAAYFKDHPQAALQIEGNCDERGTNEYNLALGERRAMSAKKYLVNLGVGADQLRTISFGEEQPINFGHDELSWSQNRRDDFVVVK